MEKLRVLHINTIDGGGAAIAAIRLHRMLLSRGIDSRILFLKRSSERKIENAFYFEDFYPKKVFKLLDKINTAYNRRFTFRKPEIYFNGPDALFDLSKHPEFQNADVVHFHWAVKFIDWQSVFSHQKKFVWTLHDMNPFTGGEHYKTGYNGEFSAVSKRTLRFKTETIKSSNLTVISPSEWLKELASKSEVFKSKKTLCLRNPVNTEIFKALDREALKEQLQLKTERKILLFVAENPHDIRKGFHKLMEALKDKDLKFQLAIVGNPEHVRSDFPDAVFAGVIKDEAVLANWYNVADAFVIPSLEDNLPNTVSEALLCGTPVCGFAVGGIKEMVKNGINGQLAEDFNGLATALKKIQDSVFDRQVVRRSALEELNPEKLFQEFMNVYKQA